MGTGLQFPSREASKETLRCQPATQVEGSPVLHPGKPGRMSRWLEHVLNLLSWKSRLQSHLSVVSGGDLWEVTLMKGLIGALSDARACDALCSKKARARCRADACTVLLDFRLQNLESGRSLSVCTFFSPHLLLTELYLAITTELGPSPYISIIYKFPGLRYFVRATESRPR